MKTPLRRDMPLALSLPLHFDLGLRTRRRRRRRFLIAALALATLVAAGAWLPARAVAPPEAELALCVTPKVETALVQPPVVTPRRAISPGT